MIKTAYTKAFEELWSVFDETYGKKGSKFRAHKEFQALKVDPEDLEMLLSSVISQQFKKDTDRMNDGFFENFPHVERWLKNRRWEE